MPNCPASVGQKTWSTTINLSPCMRHTMEPLGTLLWTYWLFIFVLFIFDPLWGKFGRLTWVIQATAVARAALPIPTRVCSVSVYTSNGLAARPLCLGFVTCERAAVFGICNVRAGADRMRYSKQVAVRTPSESLH